MWHWIHDWFRSGNWAPTFQGVATLVGVFVALITVIWQIRSSSKRVQDQIGAQRDAEREEQKRKSRAVACALSAEIDDFYVFFLKGLWEHREKICGPIPLLLKPPPELGPLPSTALVVYKSTAHQLGLLSPITVKHVVGLGNFMANFMDHYDVYRKASLPSSRFDDPELATKLLDVFYPLPRLILECDRTCELLAEGQGIPYDRSGFGIARIRDAEDKGGTTKEILEEEAANAAKRLADSYAAWHADSSL